MRGWENRLWRAGNPKWQNKNFDYGLFSKEGVTIQFEKSFLYRWEEFMLLNMGKNSFIIRLESIEFQVILLTNWS